MTFELMRAGWPNMVAVLALAIMPVMALTAPVGSRPAAAHTTQIQPTAMCQTADCSVVAVADLADLIQE